MHTITDFEQPQIDILDNILQFLKDNYYNSDDGQRVSLNVTNLILEEYGDEMNSYRQIVDFLIDNGYTQTVHGSRDPMRLTPKGQRVESFSKMHEEALIARAKEVVDKERERKFKKLQIFGTRTSIIGTIGAVLIALGTLAWNIYQGSKIKPLEEKMQRIDSLESKVKALENYNDILEWRMKPLEDSLEAQYKRDYNEKNILPYMKY